MSEQPEKMDPMDPAEEKVRPIRAGAAAQAPIGASSDGAMPRRPHKKVPIINRKGPSEVDRYAQFLHGKPSQSRNTGKKTEGIVARGTVLRMDRVKGFGFLVDQAGDHRFFHCSAVLDEGFEALNEQDAVDFEPYSDERGARAIKVRPAGTVLPPAKPVREPKASPKATKPEWRSDLSPFRNGTRASTTKKWKI